MFLAFIQKSRLFHTAAISRKTWSLIWLYKVGVALMYNWLNHEIPTFFDSGFYFKEGNIVYSALKENPLYYLQLLLFPNNYFPEPEHLCPYIDKMGLWYDYTGYTIVRVNAFFRLFSFGYLSVHFLFFGFLSFIGCYYLYKFFAKVTDLNDYLILFIIHCVPGITFWISGLHKEALVIFAIGVIVYNMHELTLKATFKRIFLVTIFMIFLLNVRFYLVLIFVPAMIAYVWNEKNKNIAIVPYLVIYGSLIVSLLIFDSIVPNDYRIANKISEFQKAFIKSKGNTSFEIDVISNSWMNILELLPVQFVNGFIYPLYNQCFSDWCRLASVESVLITFIIVLCLFFVRIKSLIINRIALFCLSIGLSWMTIIGIVVNNAGAIVRYRSIALLFILFGLLLSSQKTTKKV